MPAGTAAYIIGVAATDRLEEQRYPQQGLYWTGNNTGCSLCPTTASTAGAHPAAPVILILRWQTASAAAAISVRGSARSDPHRDCVMVVLK